MNKERIQFLLRRFASDQASETEIAEMLGLLRGEGGDETLEAFIMELSNEPPSPLEPAVDWEEVWANINKKTWAAPVKKLAWMRVAAAVAVLVLLSVGGYFYFTLRPFDAAQGDIATRFKNDILPGGNKAILTLANGQQILLDSASKGMLTRQGNTKVIKLDSGQLAYNAAGKNEEVLYNTISTPNGGQYKIILADGSKVWLNAASSLRFPTSFTRDRGVELTGEGYFEVVHNSAKPFRVSLGAMMVEDLGTRFNINAYDDENVIKTTLLEGSVKVNRGDASEILKPGQQALLRHDDRQITMAKDVDLERETAWKNSLFIFSSDDIGTVMRQIARWYDVKVEFQGAVTGVHFTGIIKRDNNVSAVLKMLEGTGKIKFSIDGKKIIVMR